MYDIGSLVTYRAMSGPVKCRIKDIIPDIDHQYYALEVLSRKHPYYQVYMEVLVRTDSPFVVYRRPTAHKPKQVKSHCVNGHEFTPDNFFYEKSPGRENVRHCRVCHRDSNNRSYANRKTND